MLNPNAASFETGTTGWGLEIPKVSDSNNQKQNHASPFTGARVHPMKPPKAKPILEWNLEGRRAEGGEMCTLSATIRISVSQCAVHL
eukprot:5232996-Prymnesium_polylepis.2